MRIFKKLREYFNSLSKEENQCEYIFNEGELFAIICEHYFNVKQIVDSDRFEVKDIKVNPQKIIYKIKEKVPPPPNRYCFAVAVNT